MRLSAVGKLLMTIAVAIFTFIPPLADLATDTHVFHPDWTPHARMHTVWLLGLSSSVGLVALYFLWFSKMADGFRVNMAGVLAVCVYGAFFLASLTVPFYGGALSDQHGGVAHTVFGMDINLVTFGVASILLGAGWKVCLSSKNTLA